MDIDRAAVEVATRAPHGATNAYLVGNQDALLIDPAGRTDELDTLVDRRDVSHVAVTHHHPDHVGAVAAYAEARDAVVWARTGRERPFSEATGVDPDRTFADGSYIDAGPGVTVLDTPGHAPEHVAFATGGGIVTGDLAVAEGSVVVGAPSGDMRAYITSLRRLHARNPRRLFPGHGPVIRDARATLSRLIDHRRARESRVLAAVHGGASTVDRIVDAAYDKDLAGVRDLAAATVEAHLEKLAVEGRLQWVDGIARLPE